MGMNGTRGEYKVGIVGHEEKKFDVRAAAEAKQVIINILKAAQRRHPDADIVVVSGGCHLGGVDVWVEEAAIELGVEKIIFYPKKKRWEPDGYKDRNIKIAEAGDEVHSIVVKRYPGGYRGLRFCLCYHCKTTNHVKSGKSGACWTARYAEKLGKKTKWHEI